MPLSEEEQRLLEQMEQALAAEDPKFVSTIRGASARIRTKHLAIAATVGFVLGVAILMLGAATTRTVLAVAGFLVMLGCAYAATVYWRRLRDPGLPANVRRLGKPKVNPHPPPRPAKFLNRMEDRWRRRRDGSGF